MSRYHTYLVRGLWLFPLMLLLLSCDKTGAAITGITGDTFVPVDFEFPDDANGVNYQIKVNGQEIGRSVLLPQNQKIEVEISLDGKVVYSGGELEIPVDHKFAFYFIKALGYDRLINIPLDQRHPLTVTVIHPYEGMKILIKGLDGAPNGVEVISGQTYTVYQADLAKGDVVVEVYKEEELLYTELLERDSTETNISLVEDAEHQLTQMTPPDSSLRDQLVGPYDTWLSFFYSSKDYPDASSLVLELAPSRYFTDPHYPESLKEGVESIVIELTPDQPTDFVLVNELKEHDALWIYKVYDPAKPEQPLLTIEEWGVVFRCDANSYNMQGENGYKFRTYKLVPKDSPEIPDEIYAFASPFPLYQKGYSFK
ncbi:MAG: hypothetical protein Q4D93_06780 [Porphyromonas sp.]|nr:hypothetical protein [Porphyromonas sp.]